MTKNELIEKLLSIPDNLEVYFHVPDGGCEQHCYECRIEEISLVSRHSRDKGFEEPSFPYIVLKEL